MTLFGRIGLFILVLFTFAFSKEKKSSPEATAKKLRQHVSFLASEALKGRLTGSEEDSLAADYILKQLIKSGLTPLFDQGFQRYRVTDKIIEGPDNSLTINGVKLKTEIDFAPFAFSGNGIFHGEVVFAGYGFEINEDSLKWNDYAGIVNILR